MTVLKTQTRLLWNEPSVIGVCAVALLLTIGIIVWQLSLRTGIFDLDGLPVFYRLFLFQDYPAAILFTLVLLLALVPGLQHVATTATDWLGNRPVGTSVCVCVCLAAGAYWVYDAYPLAMDEAAPYMQAKVFASGALVGRLPPDLLDWLVFPPFQDYFVHVSHETGQIASAYWPGFALLLTPFMALGVPWLCNPVLGGLSVWVIYRLTLDLSESPAAAGAAALFTMGSAAFVVNSISFYSMTAHLLCNGIFALLLLRPTPPRAAAAGLVGGLALTLHNPVPHMLFAAPWLIWIACLPDRRRLLCTLAAGYLPWVMVVGFGWQQLLQSLGEGTPAAAEASDAGAIAGAVAALSGVFQIPGLTQLLDRVIGLSKLWLWGAPMLVLMAGIGFWMRRRDMRVKLLATSATLTFLGYVFVPLSQGHGWGFRYLHSAWLVLPVLASLVVAPPRQAGAGQAPPAASPLVRYALAATLGGLLVITPFFLWQVHTFIKRHLAQLPASDHGRPRVVIINPLVGYYAQDLAQNDPFLRAPVIHMITQGRDNDAAMMARSFPDLVLLSKGYRGSVWGYSDDTADSSAASSALLVSNDSREVENESQQADPHNHEIPGRQ